MASPLATVLASAYQPPGQFRPGTVAPTNVGDIVAQSQDAAYKTYAAQLQKQNAMFGGLAGLGSAGVLAFGPKLQGALFGGGAGSAASSPGLMSSLFSGFGSLGGAPAAADAGITGLDAGLTGLAGIGSDAAAGDLLASGAAAAAAPVVADAGAASVADLLPLLMFA